MAGAVSAALIWASAALTQNIYTRAPVALPPGGSVSSLPNGGAVTPATQASPNTTIRSVSRSTRAYWRAT